ncbi:MAG TPA: ATP-dependent DNA helicase RecG [Solirubrobacteraceae bacterium]|nr:ATP-dependent DNA helicase RecG [Solirubrobacteraceae bacterium]
MPTAEEIATPRERARTGGFGSAAPVPREQLLAAPVRWPTPSRLCAPLPAATKRVAAALRTLGIENVGELLEHLPSDSRPARTVAGLGRDEQATVNVEVRAISARPVRRRGMRPLVQATVFDATATMRATFFNQPWLVERYPPGTRLLLAGKADGRGGFRVSHHALAAGIGGPEEAGEVAHYPASEGVTSTQIVAFVAGARAALRDVVEPLPALVRSAERLPDRAAALTAMHYPRQPEERELARERLAFDELLLAQLVFLRRRAVRSDLQGAAVLDGPADLTRRWLEHELPFAPTGDQRAAIELLHEELASPRPMERLLMGEVGSGKTVVALYAMLRAVEHGRQAALMAPTETLAEQHFATIQRLLGGQPVALALLTGSTPASRRADTLGKLASGELSLIVGTHALIEPDVRFADLAVAVVDEQHRFGVRQRSALVRRTPERPPHVLHMTATPIPRTLALARYGDLDTVALHERPQGRPPVETQLVAGERARASAYERLRAELGAGRQAFVVCPLIVESDADGGGAEGLRAATAEVERLRAGELRGVEIELLHGGMRAREKQAAMGAFAGGRAKVLVATTVIEVGIDVPNATVMLIENAERFGISQLHQLRGRVGRGEHPGICFLAGPAEAGASARLRALTEHDDGFALAEVDLRLRKEGELLGTRQSGIASELRVARLPDDEELLARARARAEAIVAEDPRLELPEHALLADALSETAAAPIPG